MAIALTVAFTVTPAVDAIVIMATPQVSAGRNFLPRSMYKQVAVVAVAGASPANILAAYNALFGALISGRKIFFRIQPISASGIPGQVQDFTKIVT